MQPVFIDVKNTSAQYLKLQIDRKPIVAKPGRYLFFSNEGVLDSILLCIKGPASRKGAGAFPKLI